MQELRQHGVDDGQVAELRDQLRSTEHERALEVWRKRFGEKPADRAAYAKQARFLASRGFAQDDRRIFSSRILGGAGDEETWPASRARTANARPQAPSFRPGARRIARTIATLTARARAIASAPISPT